MSPKRQQMQEILCKLLYQQQLQLALSCLTLRLKAWTGSLMTAEGVGIGLRTGNLGLFRPPSPCQPASGRRRGRRRV